MEVWCRAAMTSSDLRPLLGGWLVDISSVIVHKYRRFVNQAERCETAPCAVSQVLRRRQRFEFHRTLAVAWRANNYSCSSFSCPVSMYQMRSPMLVTWSAMRSKYVPTRSKATAWTASRGSRWMYPSSSWCKDL